MTKRIPPKDVLLYCLDVGPGMSHLLPNGQTVLDNAIDVVKLMAQRKLFSESKDLVGLVLFGCNDTENELAEDGMYQHIKVVANPLQISFDFLELVTKHIESGPADGDFLDAITVCLDILHNQSDQKIEKRQIVLLSNFSQPFSVDNLDGITNGFKSKGKEIELHVISPPFDLNTVNEDVSTDDEQPGPSHRKRPKVENLHAKPKTINQLEAEKIITRILDEEEINGAVYTFSTALQQTAHIEKRSVKSVAWKCNLEIGDNFAIPCAAYVKVKRSTLKHPFKKCHAKSHKPEDVEIQRYYAINDMDQNEVDKETVIKGYKYGHDVIPFSKEDKEETKYPSEGKCLAVLGFTKSSNIKRHQYCGDQTHVIVPEEGGEAGLCSLILGMQNQDVCAVARYIYRKGLNPKLVALIPRVKNNQGYLVMVSLPYAEDVRNIDFPLPVKEKSASVEQEKAIDEFMDAMTCDKENELYVSNNMLNPYFQRIFQCIQSRGLGEKQLPEAEDRIKMILSPNEYMKQKSKPSSNNLKKIFKVHSPIVGKSKPVQGHGTWENKVSTESNISTPTAVLSNKVPAITTVGSVVPEEDFKAIIQNAKDNASIEQAFKELQQRIMEFVKDFIWSGINCKVIPSIHSLRSHATKYNRVKQFNEFLNDLKWTLKQPGNKSPYWEQMVSENITLIAQYDHTDGASHEEVDTFFTSDAISIKSSNETKASDDDDIDPEDLLKLL